MQKQKKELVLDDVLSEISDEGKYDTISKAGKSMLSNNYRATRLPVRRPPLAVGKSTANQKI